MLNENIRNIFYIKIKNKNVYSQFDELFIIITLMSQPCI